MKDFIYEYGSYVFGFSLLFWLIGGPFHVVVLLTFSAWIGLIGSFIWCWNVILDKTLDVQSRILMNLVPLIWFIASWAYLVGLYHVA